MTRDEYVAQLQAAGHFRGLLIHQENDRWRVECECGYRSTTRTSRREAIGTIQHHRDKVMAEFKRNGVAAYPRGAARV